MPRFPRQNTAQTTEEKHDKMDLIKIKTYQGT